MAMTKKQFKQECSFHEYGKGRTKRNAIYFDWKTNDQGNGFKYMVKTMHENYNKAELFNILYEWVFNEVQPDYYVQYRFASNDKDRFKVSIMG